MPTNGTSPHDISSLPVAVDAMGGDHGLTVQVEGAILAAKEFGAASILVGPRDDLAASLESFGGTALPITFAHAPEYITMDDSPARAVRRKPNSSLCVAYDLVQQGKASACLSAGNSGAMMAAGRIICGLLPGIERPAIATLIPVPGNGRPNVILDTGANVDCHAQNLMQFAVMGSIYYQSLFEGTRPRVALLSNGSEASKGTDVIRAAAVLISQLESLNYVGYVEGRDVTTTKAEVIVCDGFVGNVVLKASEGCVRLIYEQLLHEGKKGLRSKAALLFARGILREVFIEKFDYTAHGGAPLLGLTKLAIVLHGSSDRRAVKNAIRLANAFAHGGMTEKISQALAQVDDRMLLEIDGSILSGVFAKAGEPRVENAQAKAKRGDALESDPEGSLE